MLYVTSIFVTFIFDTVIALQNDQNLLFDKNILKNADELENFHWNPPDRPRTGT